MTDTNATSTPSTVSISLVAVPFQDRTGQRGRPQRHPQLAVDFSCAPKAVEANGEKKVRNEAFKQLRATLGVDAKVPCCEHPKDPSLWIMKAECGRNDYVVAVHDAE